MHEEKEARTKNARLDKNKKHLAEMRVQGSLPI
jgi:hypothetical protein